MPKKSAASGAKNQEKNVNDTEPKKKISNLMRFIFGLMVLGMILVIGSIINSPNTDSIVTGLMSSNITVEDDINFLAVQSAIKLWMQKYGCKFPFKVTKSDDLIYTGVYLSTDHSLPGEMSLVPLEDKEVLQYTVLHSFPHSCKSPDTVSIETITLPDGRHVYGYHGLSLIVNEPDGKYFTALEEALAEYLALQIQSHGEWEMRPIYIELECFLSYIWDGTPEELWDLAQNNQFDAVAQRFWKTNDKQTNLERTMLVFGNIQGEGVNCQEAINIVEEYGWR